MTTQTEPAPSTIDTSLLRGLDPIMSPPEQAQLTALLTSGNPNDLASAAQIFHTLSSLLVKSGTLATTSTSSSSTQQQERTVEESQRVQDSFAKAYKKPSTNNKKDVKIAFNNYESRVRKDKLSYDAEQRSQKRILPLPVRMPRLVIIENFDPDGTPVPRRKILGGGMRIQKPSLVFVDDEWDGTLGSAFTKFTVKKDRPKVPDIHAAIRSMRDSNSTTGVEVHVVVGELQEDNKGMLMIAELLEGGYDAKLQADAEARVLIADAHNDAAKLGLHRGDIVTHVNGGEFRGSAEELNLLIKAQFCGAEEGKLELVVNAELAIAEALRLRSLGQ
jgi:hypothetical protein